jgi:hypothetical protein
VLLPADTDLGSVRRKLAFDLYYVERLSPLLDLRILVCTALYALGLPYRTTGRLLDARPSAGVEALVEDGEAPAPADGVAPRGRKCA